MVLNKLKDQVNGNKPLTERGKWVSLSFTFGIDNDDYLIETRPNDDDNLIETRRNSTAGKLLFVAL